jgi:hypothetical protein
MKASRFLHDGPVLYDEVPETENDKTDETLCSMRFRNDLPLLTLTQRYFAFVSYNSIVFHPRRSSM